MNDPSERPQLAITLGDVAGVGPEVVVKALADPAVRRCCRPIVIGRESVLRRTAALCDLPLDADGQEVIDSGDVGSLDDVPIGQPSAQTGNAAYQWLQRAIDLALAGDVAGLVTAPISKYALSQAGHDYPGHTEILAERCGVAEFAMMLYLPPGDVVRGAHGLSVAHATLHTSVASVPGLLCTDRVVETIRLVDRFLASLGCTAPRVGVCALNPHAGEEGLFGDEEQRVIQPAVDKTRESGVAAQGPFPADTLLKRAADGEFDGVVAMYHDQGHIALKLLAFGRAVNVTLGLPIVRTSPSHGTAFDVAGRNVADPAGMIAAIKTAAMLASRT